MKRAFLFLLATLSASAQGTTPVSGYVVTGLVTDNSGTAIADSVVNLERLPPYPKGAKWQRVFSVTSGKDGGFRFDRNLSTGVYRMCVQGANGILDPCKWGSNVSTVAVVGGRNPTTASLVVSRGAMIPIIVQDLGRYLQSNLGVTAGAHLLIGVTDDALLFEAATLVSESSTERTYQVVVPYGRTVNLSVTSALFHLSNILGVALPKQGTTSIPLMVSVGQPPPPINLTVTGITTAVVAAR